MSGSLTPAIPASQIVSVVPSVLSAGGTALDLNGLLLTDATRIPIGTVMSFPTALSVSQYFGATAPETALANVYFNGFAGSTKLPGAMLMAQYPWTAAVSAFLRGGSLATMTLTQLQALSGTLTISTNGTPLTSSAISLSAATSFSNAATIITAAFTSPPFGVTFDSVSSAFVFTTTATGSTETISFATGTLAAGLLLTQATGAVVSPGSAIAVPATFMASIVALTTNWASFMTNFEPVTADKEAFASWTNSTGNRYLYAMWDSNILNTESGTTTTAVQAIVAAGYSGIAMQYLDPNDSAFLMGYVASLNFTAVQGRATAAFKNQSGLAVTVTNATAAANLISYGMNFYGNYSTANDSFLFFYPGQITGPFKWVDSYVNQIWLNNQFQLALMVLLTNVNSIPYNAAGYALIEAACADVIGQGVTFGAIQPGVTLSAAQIAEVNNTAGKNITPTLASRGWYLQVSDALPQVRAARQSPPMTFWYMDGGSVQQINLASIEVQ
ncbi:MAG TPA: DUF3383 domain-containing protein [Rhodopila sp.]|nr:DUF3383 domain-containing protein [Rhodopila sp.]